MNNHAAGFLAAARWLTSLVTLIALSVLAGWAFEQPALRGPSLNDVAMNPLTAIILLVISLSFFLLHKKHHVSALTCGVVVTILAAVRLSATVFSFDPVIDRLLFAEMLEQQVIPNRMAPNTATAGLLCGISIIFYSLPRPSAYWAQFSAVLCLLLSLLSLMGYLYRVEAFYSFMEFIPMSLYTAFCFFFIALALLFYAPQAGIMEPFSSPYSGSLLARYLLPAAILVPVLLGMIRLKGEWAQLYSGEFGTALFAISIIAFFLILIRFNAKMINKRDLQRVKAEAQLQELNVRLEQLVEERTAELAKSTKIYETIAANIPNASISIIDRSGKYLLMEGELITQLGYDRQAMIGKRIGETVSAEAMELLKSSVDKMLAGERVALEMKPRDRYFYMQFVPLANADGEVDMGMMMALDITALKEAQLQVENMNKELERKVKDRTEQLTMVNRELEAFSYSVSHDLRAPLRAIDGYTRMIEEDYLRLFDSEGRRMLEAVQYNARKMGNLIDDLLAFSRLGKKELQKSVVDMNELMEGTLQELSRTTALTAKIDVGELHPVPADYALMSQVVANLISNAVKYSSKAAEPRITISSAKDEDYVTYSVKDNGVGFNMKYADKLFGVFQRLHSMEQFEGTGVGLAIVQRIISKHGGTVWANAEENKGAEFCFRLPLK
jgi:PAS domain S-box-containing protein